MLVEIKVETLAMDRLTQMPILLLKANGADESFPIWIGPAEAQAIGVVLEDIAPPRPLTHDLLHSTIDLLSGGVTRDPQMLLLLPSAPNHQFLSSQTFLIKPNVLRLAVVLTLKRNHIRKLTNKRWKIF